MHRSLSPVDRAIHKERTLLSTDRVKEPTPINSITSSLNVALPPLLVKGIFYKFHKFRCAHA